MKPGVLALALLAGAAQAADLSPEHWPAGVRQQAEAQEFRSWSPLQARVRQTKAGVISASVSPVAVEAGLQVLRQGGSAADAAATTSFTEITTQLGSVVSFAGIMTMLYYDAKTETVWSLDAGYGSYRGETDPKSIPPSDISGLTGGPAPAPASDLGRQTLVPGFMAGMEAMQRRFGRLRFADTLAPAIWYAENGVKISAPLAYFFQARQKQLARTAEGRAFLAQAGGDLPKMGDTFRQKDLAETLRAVTKYGSREMYTGAWAKKFVETVRREGGKVAAEDLSSYEPVWSAAPATNVWGHTVYTIGGNSLAPYQLLTALNAAEVMKLERRGPYWSDVDAFLALNRLGEVVAGAPTLHPATEQALKMQGIDTSAAGQRSKAHARALAAALPSLYGGRPDGESHTNAVVVVDKDGNVAVVTHTIYSLIWGGTGIVVGGIPLPDSAGLQQERLARLAPGAMVPNEIADALVLDAKGRPVLASAVVGSSELPETLRVIVSTIAQRQPLDKVAAAPPLLISVDPKSYALPFGQRPVIIPAGVYDAAFLDSIRAAGTTLVEMPAAAVSGIRGTLSLVGMDGATRLAPEVPGVMVYAGTE